MEARGYQVYPARWVLLVSVVLLNLANYSHWVAFPAVAKQAAAYYQVTGEQVNTRLAAVCISMFMFDRQVDLIASLSYGLCVPTCLVAVWCVERLGLRAGLVTGALLTAGGGALCCLATLPDLLPGLTNQAWDRNTAYTLTLAGQALTGIGCPFISCVPTKVGSAFAAFAHLV